MDRINTILNNCEQLAKGNFKIDYAPSPDYDEIDTIGLKLKSLAIELNSNMIPKNHLKNPETLNQEVLNELNDYKQALEESSIISYTDKNGKITFVNDLFCKVSKYSKEEVIGKNHRILNSGYHPKSFWKDMWQTISTGETWKGKIKNQTKDGNYYWVYTTIIPFLKEGKPYKYLSIRNDVTELVTAENLLLDNIQNSLQEKNTLIKEIHHRVKNNLQVITSLLSLQAGFIDDEKTKGLFRYSQYRINSMAMVHEMLYRSEDLSRINFKDYVTKLIEHLINSYVGTDHHIVLNVNVKKINLNIDTAIPLGLLINEIITNSLKYGFANINEGEIMVEIKALKHPNFILRIGDSGVGFNNNVNFRNTQSLGLQLMHRLALQLKGNLEKDNSKPGTNYILSFQEIRES